MPFDDTCKYLSETYPDRFVGELFCQFFKKGIMRESVIYQEILEEGREESKWEEALAYTRRLLTRRIGALEPEMEAEIRELTTQDLEELGEALLDFSELADLTAWLQARQESRQD
jgi:predicted transposase YdaD